MRNVANTNITSSLVLLQNRTSENIAEEYYGGHPKTAHLNRKKVTMFNRTHFILNHIMVIIQAY